MAPMRHTTLGVSAFFGLVALVAARFASGAGFGNPVPEPGGTLFQRERGNVLSTLIRASGSVDAALIDRKGAEAALTSRIRTTGPGVPIVVFNSLPWSRTDAVDCSSPFPPVHSLVSIMDERGRVYPGQALGDRLFFTARDVPSMGYKVFWATRTRSSKETGASGKGFVIQNQSLRVTIDSRRGTITSMYDKSNKRELVRKSHDAAAVEFTAPVQPQPAVGLRSQELVGNTEVVLMESGPARARVTWDHYFGNSQVNLDAILFDGVPRLDLVVTLDWQEEPPTTGQGPSLRLLFPFALGPAAVSAAAFDSYQVSDGALEDSPLRWIDVTSAGYGVTTMTDFATTQSWTGGTIGTTLVGLTPPYPSSQWRTSEMRVSLYPHKADWRLAGTEKRALEVATPLLGVPAAVHKEGKPASGSFVSMSGGTAVITGAALLDGGRVLEMTVSELQGRQCSLTLRCRLPYTHYAESAQMQPPPAETKPITGGAISVPLAPGESKTIRLLK